MSSNDSYRVPEQPGFLGGVNLRGALIAMVVFAATNVAVTQWLAYTFDYQQALGTPIVRMRNAAFYIWIYKPWAWAFWICNNWWQADTGVRNTLLLALAAEMVGAVLSALAMTFSNVASRKRLSRNAEDLYGSARMADHRDVTRTRLLGAEQGVFVGAWQKPNSKTMNYLRHDGPEHVLAFAPTRSGKGVSLVIPTLLAWSESAVIYDIKGENWEKTAGFRNSAGHLCFRFSPAEDGTSSRFNPLAEIRLYTKYDVKDAQNIAHMLTHTGEHSGGNDEQYWIDSAASIITGMILHVCYEMCGTRRTACLADLAQTFTHPGKSFRDTLGRAATFPHDPAFAHSWTLPNGDLTMTHPVVLQKCQEMLDKEDRDFGGVLSTARTTLSLYSDPLVSANTGSSDFTINDLVNNDRPVSLYLIVPPSDIERLRPLTRLIFTAIVHRLSERLDTKCRNKHGLLFLIDEFPSLKRMDLFANALSYMAGYGMKAFLIAQDLRQLRAPEAYGHDESIVSNCHTRVAFTPNTQETAELLSKMTGERTIQRATYSFSGKRSSGMLGQVSASVDTVHRPVMTADEISRLPSAVKAGRGAEEKIIAPGDALIFVAGHRPIRGKQILYFQDPELARRSAIAPPTMRLAIGPDGELVHQAQTTKAMCATMKSSKNLALSTAATVSGASIRSQPEEAKHPTLHT